MASDESYRRNSHRTSRRTGHGWEDRLPDAVAEVPADWAALGQTPEVDDAAAGVEADEEAVVGGVVADPVEGPGAGTVAVLLRLDGSDSAAGTKAASVRAAAADRRADDASVVSDVEKADRPVSPVLTETVGAAPVTGA